MPLCKPWKAEDSGSPRARQCGSTAAMAARSRTEVAASGPPSVSTRSSRSRGISPTAPTWIRRSAKMTRPTHKIALNLAEPHVAFDRGHNHCTSGSLLFRIATQEHSLKVYSTLNYGFTLDLLSIARIRRRSYRSCGMVHACVAMHHPSRHATHCRNRAGRLPSRKEYHQHVNRCTPPTGTSSGQGIRTATAWSGVFPSSVPRP